MNRGGSNQYEQEAIELQRLPRDRTAARDVPSIATGHVRCNYPSGVSELNTVPAPVVLLQTTLRSSQIQSLRHRLRLPVSGHWALLIRNEVFELNRTTRWLWYYKSRPREQNEFGIGMLNAFASVPQFGACAQLDRCSIQQYLQDRGNWTTAVHLGTTCLPQETIHKAIDRQNQHPIFYSFLSNNCQHFIVDLCDYLEMNFCRDEPAAVDQVSQSPLLLQSIDTSQNSPYTPGNLLTAEATSIQRLWLKSRLILLLTGSLHFLISVTPPFALLSITRMFQSKSPFFVEEGGFLFLAVEIAMVIIIIFSHAMPMWLSFAAYVICEDPLPKRLDGSVYRYGSCATGAFMRRQLLETPDRSVQFLFRFLLRVERVSYWAYMLLAFSINLFITVGDVWIPALEIGFSDEHIPNQLSERAAMISGLATYWGIGIFYIVGIWREQSARLDR